jgi:hypothetical protein
VLALPSAELRAGSRSGVAADRVFPPGFVRAGGPRADRGRCGSRTRKPHEKISGSQHLFLWSTSRRAALLARARARAMHRHQPARRSRADIDAVYTRLSSDESFSTQAAYSRATQRSFRGWMETKGAEASGSNREAHLRALVVLNQYPLLRQPFTPVGCHPVSRNEYLCQRSVAPATRMGSYHPISWAPGRTGPHLHRNGKRRLAPLPAAGSRQLATDESESVSEREEEEEEGTTGAGEGELTPRRAATALGGEAQLVQFDMTTPEGVQRPSGARSASPAFSPLQDPSSVAVPSSPDKLPASAGGGGGDMRSPPPSAVGTPTAWGTVR